MAFASMFTALQWYLPSFPLPIVRLKSVPVSNTVGELSFVQNIAGFGTPCALHEQMSFVSDLVHSIVLVICAGTEIIITLLKSYAGEVNC